MRPIRSILYIPANNEDWVLEAPEKYDADAFIFDLEDSVPPARRNTHARSSPMRTSSGTLTRPSPSVSTHPIPGCSKLISTRSFTTDWTPSSSRNSRERSI